MAELRRHVAEELADARRRAGPRPQRLPQEGGRVLRRGPPVVRPAGQDDNCQVGVFLAYAAAERLRPAGPAALPARGLGRRRGPPREVPRPGGGPFREKWRIALDLLDRSLPGSAARLGRRRRRVRPGRPSSAPRCAAAASGTCWTCRATPTIRDLERRRPRRRRAGRGRKRQVAVPAGRRLGGRPAGVAVGAADGPRRREGPLEVEAMTVRVQTKAGAAGRPGGAAGGHPDRRASRRSSTR